MDSITFGRDVSILISMVPFTLPKKGLEYFIKNSLFSI